MAQLRADSSTKDYNITSNFFDNKFSALTVFIGSVSWNSVDIIVRETNYARYKERMDRCPSHRRRKLSRETFLGVPRGAIVTIHSDEG